MAFDIALQAAIDQEKVTGCKMKDIAHPTVND